MKTYKLLALPLVLLLGACSVSIPEDAALAGQMPEIWPDYTSLSLPPNIAPLNFRIETSGDNYVSRIYNRHGQEIVVGGRTLDVDTRCWHDLLQASRGDSVWVDVYVRRDGSWLRYNPIAHYVTDDEIDPYIAYRLIEPSYIAFEHMKLCQRNLETFEQSDIWSNSTFDTRTGSDAQCCNCHSFQNYNRSGNMQMHLRVYKGGTVIVNNGEIKKINLRTEITGLPGVYPAWHPTLPLIAYSMNSTGQSFYSMSLDKVEVQDATSNLMLYEVENDRINIVTTDSTTMQTFPAWNPQGDQLYYVAADLEPMSDENFRIYQQLHYKDFKYNIFRRDFDAQTKVFGPQDTVFMATDMGKSAIHPRISPDGRWLMFAMAEFGTFHIWHNDSDLWIMDLTDNTLRQMDELNSDRVESYHSFSSNGRWVLFSSRRDDGNYTRLYIAHFDPATGTASKPFLLPQRNPEHNLALFKSYNIPEFMAEPFTVSKSDLMKVVEGDPREVSVSFYDEYDH